MTKSPSTLITHYNIIGAIYPPLGGVHNKLFLMLYFVRLILNIVLFTFCCLHVFFEEKKFVDKLSTVQYAVSLLHVLSKQLWLLYKKDEFHEIIKDFDELRKFVCLKENGLKLLEKEYKVIKNISLFLFLGVTMTCPVSVLLAVVNHILHSSDKKPFEFFVPFETFWAATIAQTILMTNGAMYYGSYLSIFGTVTYLISTKMELLRELLILGELNKTVYKYHQDIVRTMNRTNKLFSGIMAFEMIMSGAQTSCVGYAFMIEFKRRSSVWLQLFYIFVVTIFTAFIPCFFGNIVIGKNKAIFIASYQNEWYSKDVSYRKDLYTFMIMASKTLSYNYRNQIYFNMELFTMFVRGTYAYLSALEAVTEEI